MTATKLSTPFLLAAALLFTSACDSEELAATDERAAELDAEFAPEQADGECEGKGEGRMNPADRLCEEIACSDEQRGQIEELMRSQHEARRAERGDKDARRAAHAETNAKLAEAFRAAEFDASVLAELHGERDPSKHIEAKAQFAVELHALLTPEQRGQLAKVMETRGPVFMHGPKGDHGKRGRHEGKRKGKHGESKRGEGKHAGEGKRDPEARLARHVERVCEPLACSEEQKTQLSAALSGAHEARKDGAKPDFAPLAAAFAADTLEIDTLTELMGESMGEAEGKHRMGASEIISEIHAILSPEQRAIFADKIEAEGMRGVLGKGHGKRGHGKRGEGKRHAGPKAD